MRQFKIIFILKDGKIRYATEEEYDSFFNEHLQYSRLLYGNIIKTANMIAMFEHYDRFTNSLYLKQ